MTPRILFVSSHSRPGGSERYLQRLISALDSPVAGVVALEPGWLDEELEPRPVVIATTAHWSSLLRASFALRRRLRITRPTLIHANGLKAALVAVLAAARTGVPVVWVKHDFSHGGRLSRFVAARAARVVGVSAAVVAGLPDEMRSKVAVVHPAVDVAPVDREEADRRLAVLTGRRGSEFVGVVGRLDPYKGHRELIAILPALRRRRPSVHAIFIGGSDPSHPGEEERLRAFASGLGVDDAVSWLGEQPEAWRLVAGCAAIAVPSAARADGLGQEGFGLAPLEALAVGTAVVGYATGALPEILGPCAVLTPPGDRAALCDALADVLANERRRAELAACGRELVVKRYTLAAMVAGMSKIYADVAREARDGRD